MHRPSLPEAGIPAGGGGLPEPERSQALATSAPLPDATARAIDPEALSLQELEALMQPLAASDPLVRAYMRRMQALLQRRAELLRSLLALRAQGRVAFVDLEATCYRDREESKRLPREILEIGLAVLDCGSLQVVERLQLHVRPADPRSYVSAYCTELTGIRPEQVAQAPGFAECMQAVRKLHARHRWTSWGSYGDFDRQQLAQQALASGCENPFSAWTHVDVKDIAGAYFGFGRKGPGLARAVAMAGLAFDGRQHSGLDDACNTASLVAAMLRGILPDEARRG
ncbi:3'-5' exonuclease [Caldimonas tepidiphila]|uniref:3'-5' exonuclease n=1 Tax=Caldimonas tepidiphila TaxID=2315841 RepID=UPI000E5A5A82|nr:3'-5' exonuclease [Caldimonas tepidiphila]